MKTIGVIIFISISSVLSAQSNMLQKRWGQQMIYKMPYESKTKRWEDNAIPTHNLEEDNIIPSHNLEEDSLIPSHNLEEDKKPIIQFRPSRPQILDLSHVIQFRPRPTSPPFRFPFITREQLERRKKVLMEWTLIAQVKV